MTFSIPVADASVDEGEQKTYRYPVSELFGPVCQGEGALIGRPTIFLRLGGCDYRCSWCDSKYAVLPEFRNEWVKLSIEAILARLDEMGPCRHVTLSGGNPAIHPCHDLLAALHDNGYRVAIETQGSIAPVWLRHIDDLTISPKPPSSGNVTPYDQPSLLFRIITRYEHAVLKVVVFDDDDYAYAVAVHQAFPLTPFFVQVGTEVNIASRDDLCEALIHWQDRALNDARMQDVSILPQLHALLRGHARGI